MRGNHAATWVSRIVKFQKRFDVFSLERSIISPGELEESVLLEGSHIDFAMESATMASLPETNCRTACASALYSSALYSVAGFGFARSLSPSDRFLGRPHWPMRKEAWEVSFP